MLIFVEEDHQAHYKRTSDPVSVYHDVCRTTLHRASAVLRMSEQAKTNYVSR